MHYQVSFGKSTKKTHEVSSGFGAIDQNELELEACVLLCSFSRNPWSWGKLGSKQGVEITKSHWVRLLSGFSKCTEARMGVLKSKMMVT